MYQISMPSFADMMMFDDLILRLSSNPPTFRKSRRTVAQDKRRASKVRAKRRAKRLGHSA